MSRLILGAVLGVLVGTALGDYAAPFTNLTRTVRAVSYDMYAVVCPTVNAGKRR